MALEQNFEAFSGNDLVLQIAVSDLDNGGALNLSGAIALIYSLGKSAKGVPIITKALTAGVVITDAPAGLVEITLTAADTEPLSGDYYHELRLTNSANRKVTLMFGAVTIATNLVRTP